MDEFSYYLKADLSKYEGKYVAIVGNKVAASSVDAKKVLEEAGRKYPGRESVLAKIPTEDVFV